MKESVRSFRPFSMRARLRSFRYAWQGIQEFLDTQHNAVVHLYLTVFAIMMAVFLSISNVEWVALFIVISLVWMAELFNSAIEMIMDEVMPRKSRRVRYIKDVSAAAVLISSVGAAITGLIIFIPKLF